MVSGAREREQTKKRREKPCIHHPPPSRLSLERGGVGALEGDAGVVDEDVAPAVLLLYLRGEPLASAASPGKTDTKHTKKKKNVQQEVQYRTGPSTKIRNRDIG